MQKIYNFINSFIILIPIIWFTYILRDQPELKENIILFDSFVLLFIVFSLFIVAYFEERISFLSLSIISVASLELVTIMYPFVQSYFSQVGLEDKSIVLSFVSIVAFYLLAVFAFIKPKSKYLIEEYDI